MSQLGSITAEKKNRWPWNARGFRKQKQKCWHSRNIKEWPDCRTHCIKYCRGVNCSSASFIRSKYCIYAIR